MNTIRRPRKRPRVKSVSFKTLWWLVVREAAALVWFGPRRSRASRNELESLLLYPTYALKCRTRSIIEQHPERRYWL